MIDRFTYHFGTKHSESNHQEEPEEIESPHVQEKHYLPSDKEERDREKFDQFIQWLLNTCIEKQYDPATYLRHTLYTWNPLPEEFSMKEINIVGSMCQF